MKITTSRDSICAKGWLGVKFQANAVDLSEVRVMAANEFYPRGFLKRLKIALGLETPEIKLHTVIVWAGDQGIALHSYYDKGFDEAVSWLKQHEWEMDAATADALKTPLIRITVSKRAM